MTFYDIYENDIVGVGLEGLAFIYSAIFMDSEVIYTSEISASLRFYR